MAEIISDVLGKEVRFQQISFERRPRHRRSADAGKLDADQLLRWGEEVLKPAVLAQNEAGS